MQGLGSAAREAHERTALILNAIATILVSRPGEIFAVGARLIHRPDSALGAIEIIVAGDDDIPPSTKEYLEEVWRTTQSMASTRNRRVIPKRFSMQRQPDSEILSPTGDANYHHNDEQQILYNGLITRVYTHGFQKWKRRLDKAYAQLMEFNQIFGEYVLQDLPEDHPDYPVADDVYAVLIRIEWMSEQLESLDANNRGPELVAEKEFLDRMSQAAITIMKLSPEQLACIDAWNTSDRKSREFPLSSFEVRRSWLTGSQGNPYRAL